MEPRLGREAWIWTAAVSFTYLAMAGLLAMVFLLPLPDMVVDQPIWILIATMMGGGILVGLLFAVPALMVMRRLQLWILPRNAMGLPAGPPPFRLGTRQMFRFGWGMSTGDGRAVVEHLERVRTGTPFGAAEEGIPPMPNARLEQVRRDLHKGTWWKMLGGAAAGMVVAVPMILLQEAAGPWAGLIAIVFIGLAMPVILLAGAWPNIKRWSRAYLSWIDEVNGEDPETTSA